MKKIIVTVLGAFSFTAYAQLTIPEQNAVPAQGSTSQFPASQQSPQPQWVSGAAQPGQSNAFPAPPVNNQAGSLPAQQSTTTNYNASDYTVAVPQNAQPQQQINYYPQQAQTPNGMAPLPALEPPNNYEQASKDIAPFTNDQIRELRNQLDGTRQARAYQPVRGLPRISSISLDLSPGASLPIVRTLPGEISTVVFLDATGAAWPLAAAPRVSDPRYFNVEWLQGTPSVIISALSPYETGNLVVFLQGFPTPIVLKLSSGETDTSNSDRVVDYRLDLRIPARGPNASAPLLGPGKIALYDEILQAFLDGIPPEGATRIRVVAGNVPEKTLIWQYNGYLFIRTQNNLQTAFDNSIAASDGTRVYRLPLTPYIMLSEGAQSIMLQVEIKN